MKNRSITPLPPADFTPEMDNYKTLQPFRYWCQKVLPLVYDDSLSYYELLCKVVDYLNKTMEDVETLHGDVTNLHAAYEELQSYVNKYFSSLDVQKEINNKLDNMVASGELLEILDETVSDEISKWLNYNITNPTNPPIDKSLTVENAAADAKVTGNILKEKAIKGNYLTPLNQTISKGIIKTDGITIYGNDMDKYDGRFTTLNVNAGEIYYINGFSYNYMYPCAFTLGDKLTTLLGGDNKEHISEKITIPDGATKLFVNGNVVFQNIVISKEKTGILNGLSVMPFHLYIKEPLIKICDKYSNEKDFVITLNKFGANGCFDIRSLGVKNAIGDLPSDDYTQTILVSTDSDWVSPFIVQAINNIDGDLPDGYENHFTGGTHGYPNNNSGSKTSDTKINWIKVNNIKRNYYKGYAYKVEIKATTLIQGNNTKKADGSGRNILKLTTYHKYEFGKLSVFCVIEPLEDIILKRWYGLQVNGLNNIYNNISYVGSKNRTLYNTNISSISGDSNSNIMRLNGDTDCLTLTVDKNIDLGDHKYYSGNQSLFALTYGKAYNYIIDNQNFNAGELYYLKGEYEFYSM